MLAQIEQLREKVAAYEAPPPPPDSGPRDIGLMQLGKKTKDGNVVRIPAPPSDEDMQIAQEGE